MPRARRRGFRRRNEVTDHGIVRSSKGTFPSRMQPREGALSEQSLFRGCSQEGSQRVRAGETA